MDNSPKSANEREIFFVSLDLRACPFCALRGYARAMNRTQKHAAGRSRPRASAARERGNRVGKAGLL